MRVYPEDPGFVAESRTSHAAAESMVDHAPRLREVVFRALLAHGEHGALRDDLEHELAMIHQTISPRVKELLLEKRIFENGCERRTRRNRWAAVLVANKDWAKPTNGFSAKEWSWIIKKNGIRDDQDRQSGPGAD